MKDFDIKSKDDALGRYFMTRSGMDNILGSVKYLLNDNPTKLTFQDTDYYLIGTFVLWDSKETPRTIDLYDNGEEYLLHEYGTEFNPETISNESVNNLFKSESMGNDLLTNRKNRLETDIRLDQQGESIGEIE